MTHTDSHEPVKDAPPQRAKKGIPKKRWLMWGSIVGAALIVVSLIGPVYVVLSTRQESKAESSAGGLEPRDVALVFGAGVDSDRTASPFLQARLETAVELYKRGKVKKVLLSGDNRVENYNEPYVMREAVISLGVQPEDAIADYAGLGTYDSCYRAKHIFEVDSAYLVTQGYHVPRAVYTCNHLGVDSVGIGTSRYWHIYRRLVFPSYLLREAFSINKALLEIHVFKPKATVLGEQEPIL